MEAIRKQAIATFMTKNGCPLEENVKKLATLMNALTSSDVRLDHNLLRNPPLGPSVKKTAPVTYIEILENEHFNMSIFVLRPGSKLPLHDHPLMYGFCKVIYGKVLIKNYTFLDDPLACINKQEITVQCEKDRIVSSSDDTIVLTPQVGNIHEIRALGGGGAAFIDILAPPYYSLIPGYGPRQCHYYVPILNDREKDKKSLTKRLKKIYDHPDFRTDEAPYLGP